jgi:hypothetical protein
MRVLVHKIFFDDDEYSKVYNTNCAEEKLCKFINDEGIASADIQCIHAFPVTNNSGSLVDGYASVFYWVNKD